MYIKYIDSVSWLENYVAIFVWDDGDKFITKNKFATIWDFDEFGQNFNLKKKVCILILNIFKPHLDQLTKTHIIVKSKIHRSAQNLK